MIGILLRVLLVLALLDAAYNALWVACANTPAANLYAATLTAGLLMLTLRLLERAALNWRKA